MSRFGVILSAVLALAVLTACAGEPEEVEPPPPPVVVDGVVEAADGVPIVYDAKGAGETTLVFVHCWACDRDFWREQFDLFADSYRVVRMDLPGHGASGTERENWTIAGLADDVVKLVDELGLERVVLVGHSMGGPVSLIAAPLLGERALGVACVDTLHNAEQKWDEETAASVIASFETDFEATNRQFIQMMFAEGADPELIEWVTTKAISTPRDAAIALMHDFPSLDLAQRMADTGVPIRCVNAAPLGMLIPETAIEINQAYADFDASIVDNVGHYLLLERPGEFNEKLAAAITELAGD